MRPSAAGRGVGLGVGRDDEPADGAQGGLRGGDRFVSRGLAKLEGVGGARGQPGRVRASGPGGRGANRGGAARARTRALGAGQPRASRARAGDREPEAGAGGRRDLRLDRGGRGAQERVLRDGLRPGRSRPQTGTKRAADDRAPPLRGQRRGYGGLRPQARGLGLSPRDARGPGDGVAHVHSARPSPTARRVCGSGRAKTFPRARC